MKPLCISMIMLALVGCAFQPKVHSNYDTNCNVAYDNYEFVYKPENSIRLECQSCGDPLSTLFANIALASAEALITGSMVTAGNAALEQDREARCSEKGEEPRVKSQPPSTPTIYEEEYF